MKHSSIREAKSKLSTLIRDAERGQVIHLTRRGQPVAVLVSEARYQRLASVRSRRDVMRFLEGWRREMIAKGLDFASDAEFAAAKDRAAGREFTVE